ncbi:MAG: HAD family hydrolase [Lachnospiraceae bacterium]|nr:HAD family hydrolase [Lachnospiraceae bacterium]
MKVKICKEEKAMYQNYIFDLYGTLVDIHTDEFKPSLWRQMASFYSLKGAEYQGKELMKDYLRLVDMEQERLARKQQMEISHVEIVLDKVFAKLYSQKGVKASKQLVEDTMVMFRMLSTSHIRLFPGVKDLLLRLRADGKGIYLLSNAQANFTRPEMKMLGIYDCFDGILYSSDALVKKPSGVFYQMLFDKYQLGKETAVMVGNDARADMIGAADFGIPGLYVRTDESWRPDELPNGCYEIKHIGEVYP